jgi:hypothetical protein
MSAIVHRATRHCSWALLTLALFALGATTAWADIFVLTNGGRVQGTLVNREESPRKTYVVRTAGGELTFEKAQVKEVLTQTAAQREYEDLAPRAADTIEGQWQIAEWCREHHLSRERAVHLERIIELDPDHRGARIGLGYVQMEGRWVRPDQYMEERGYVRYQGKWRMPQEIEMLEQKKKDEVAERAWYGKLKRLRDMLDDDRQGSKAHDEIIGIEDPAAVAALSSYLDKESVARVRPLYVQALGRIGTGPALQQLVAASMDDDDEEVRISSIEQIVPHKQPQIVAAYVAGLKSNDNARINRAAIALGQLKDPSTIDPLIKALVTRHKHQASVGSGPNQIGAAFSPDGSGGLGGGMGSGGLSVGSAPPKYVYQDLTNRDVLSALVGIAGVNFGYDVTAWRSWYASQKKAPAIELRRD